MSPTGNVVESILARGQGAAPAICFGAAVVSHAELRAGTVAWADRLQREGLTKGDRVGLLAENSPLAVAAYLGAIYAGCCAVPLNLDCSPAALDEIVATTGMRRIVVSERFADGLRESARRWRVGLLAGPADRLPEPARRLPPCCVDPGSDLAAIMFTSGSTGAAKGVMVTHRNIESNTRDIIGYLGLGPGDRVMAVLPFYYCYGASLLHTHLMAGGCLVLNNRFMFPEKVLDDMVEKRCTGLAGVPSTYQILLRKTSFARRSFPALRWLQQAGGRLPAPYVRELREALPAVKLFIMYGQTEATARLSYLPPERLRDKPGSIGKGLRHTRLEVLRGDGTPVAAGSDEVGEIVAQGDNVAAGYWQDAELTARYFRNGRLYTGDMARVDEDGYLYIVDRSRDFIKSMGNRVSPLEVEEVLAELPGVVEAAVVGVPDDLWGEAIHAFLVTGGDRPPTVAELHAHCLGRLPNYKIPQSFEICRSLPKTANGKIARGQLQQAAAARAATDSRL
jgi:acyl-CoA synthetase (AMP-forming)/AMP-acid ligase II